MDGSKWTDDRPAEGGTLNSGRLAPPPSEAIYLQRINDFQLTEGVAKGAQESDRIIYLHFVQDLWIKKVIGKESKGRVMFRRYADDNGWFLAQVTTHRWQLLAQH